MENKTPIYSISLKGVFSVTEKCRWEAPVFAHQQTTFCVQQNTDILHFINARLSMPMEVTQHTILFYWLSYAKD